MKVLIFSICASILFQAAYSSPARVFSLKSSGDLSGNNNTVHFDYNKKTKGKCEVYYSHIADKKMPDSRILYALACDIGLVLIDRSASNNILIFKPGVYSASISEGDGKVFVSSSELGLADYMSPVLLWYMSIKPQSYLEALKRSASNINSEIEISDNLIKYSKDGLSYAISLKEGRISTVEVCDKPSMKKLFLISFSCDNPEAESSRRAIMEIYSKSKLQYKEILEFELKGELAGNEGEELFDINNLASFEFVDTRFKPLRKYRYSKGIPSREEAASLPAISTSDSSVNPPVDSSVKSDYAQIVKKFFEAKFR